jgi:hypothetical protein
VKLSPGTFRDRIAAGFEHTVLRSRKIAEEIVEEWLNRNGYFTIQGILQR